MAGTHGKLGIVYRLLSNGFKGSGLNDLTWGAYTGASDSSYFEVVIDAAGTPDTFKWRENGGGWTAGVAITGAAQTLSGANGDQALTFGATTGHTLNDQWVIGNLYQEACTESSAQAQITDTSMRILNPNATITWTDSGGANLRTVDFVTGTAYFDANVAQVTVTGDNGFIVEAALTKVGYLFGWGMQAGLDLDEITAQGDSWKTHVAGAGEMSGSAEGYMIGKEWFDDVADQATGNQDFFLVQLFSYDPDDDQTGDHFNAWVKFNSYNANAPLGAVMKDTIGFVVDGIPGFTANA